MPSTKYVNTNLTDYGQCQANRQLFCLDWAFVVVVVSAVLGLQQNFGKGAEISHIFTDSLYP